MPGHADSPVLTTSKGAMDTGGSALVFHSNILESEKNACLTNSNKDGNQKKEMTLCIFFLSYNQYRLDYL